MHTAIVKKDMVARVATLEAADEESRGWRKTLIQTALPSILAIVAGVFGVQLHSPSGGN